MPYTLTITNTETHASSKSSTHKLCRPQIETIQSMYARFVCIHAYQATRARNNVQDDQLNKVLLTAPKKCSFQLQPLSGAHLELSRIRDWEGTAVAPGSLHQ